MNPPEMAPPPSEALNDDDLDQALMVLVVRPDGTAYSSVRGDVNRDELSAWVVEFAGFLTSTEAYSGGHDEADPPRP